MPHFVDWVRDTLGVDFDYRNPSLPEPLDESLYPAPVHNQGIVVVKLSVILILRLECIVLKKNIINVSLLFSITKFII